MKIIFDFNRTLFNPETNSLYEGALELLTRLSSKHSLFLISKNVPGRTHIVEELGIQQFFQDILFIDKKTKEVFVQLVGEDKDVLVIGDRVQDEIRIGNVLGYVTVHIKQGIFGDQLINSETKRPKHIIKKITELYDIISEYE